MADIGPLTLKVVADASKMNAGLDQARAMLNTAGTKMAGDATKTGKAIGARLADGVKGGLGGLLAGGQGVATMLEQALGDPGRFAASLTSKLAAGVSQIPIAGPLLALPLEGVSGALTFVLDQYAKGSATILDFGKAADRAGTDLGEFQVIAKALGGDVGNATAALVKWKASLVAAQGAGLGADNVFRRLGLDARDLAGKSEVEQLEAFGAKLRGLGSGTLASAAARQALGRKAGELLPILLKDPEDFGSLARTRRMLDTFGASIGEGAYANVKRAAEAAKEIGYFKEGLTNQLTIGIAPILAELGNVIPRLSELGITFKGLSGGVVEAFATAGMAVARFIDLFRSEGLWGVIKASWEKLKAWAMEGAAAIGDAIGQGLVPGIKGGMIQAIGISGMSKLGMISPSLFGFLTSGTTAADVAKAAETQRKAAEAGSNAGGGIWGMLKGAWFGTGQATGEAESAFGQFVDRVRERFASLGNTAKQNDPFASWYESMQRLKDSLESPLEKIALKAQDLQKLLDFRPPELPAWPAAFGPAPWAGAGGMLPETLFPGLGARAGFDLFSQLKSAYGSDPRQLVGAMEQNTKEAYSEIAKYQAGQQSIEEQIQQLLEEANRRQIEQLDVGKRALDAFKDFGGKIKIGGL